ncbi:MAG: hypothetical protein FWG85_03930 [Bacteroidetes bacterium]|nr:hypothetical protein [Bacteroidota bacterium]
MKNIYVLLIFLVPNVVSSQTFIDTVYSYQWGTGTGAVGREAKYFPQNIFGPPTSYANKYTQATQHSEVVSLGLDGEIVVGLKEGYIIDKDGPDFIIFENVFSNYNETKIFVEPAIVSVSNDGVNFVEFPYNTETLEGFAGINWTNGSENCFDYRISGGDAFDLADIGMDSIRYIKIKDTALFISKLPTNHKYYSPAAIVTNGFDLDAVVLLNTTKQANNDILTISNVNGNYYLSYQQGTKIAMFDINGNRVTLTDNYVINENIYASGIYFIIAIYEKASKIVKIIID